MNIEAVRWPLSFRLSNWVKLSLLFLCPRFIYTVGKQLFLDIRYTVCVLWGLMFSISWQWVLWWLENVPASYGLFNKLYIMWIQKTYLIMWCINILNFSIFIIIATMFLPVKKISDHSFYRKSNNITITHLLICVRFYTNTSSYPFNPERKYFRK